MLNELLIVEQSDSISEHDVKGQIVFLVWVNIVSYVGNASTSGPLLAYSNV